MQTKTSRELSVDAMTLAALLSKIGILPILTEAERHAEVFANPTFLEDAIEKLSARVGAKIMKTCHRRYARQSAYDHLPPRLRALLLGARLGRPEVRCLGRV